MSFSDIRKLKKVEEKEVNIVSHRFLVVGSDLFSIATYKKLVEKYGKEEVRLLTQHPITEEGLKLTGPSALRGSANISSFVEDFPEVQLNISDKISSFYKDMRFRTFGGRAKSETLLKGESFYIDPKATFKVGDIFSFINEENYLEALNEGVVQYIPVGLNKSNSEGSNWVVNCSNGTELYCEELFWGESPYSFFELHKNKTSLSDEIVEYCEKTQTDCTLNIKLVMDETLTDMDETLFLPLSYTHDWGHFIGEFSKEDESSNKQIGEFIMFVNKNETSEEEISRKIRILKKNLEKIFPNFKNISTEEFISLSDKTTSLKIDDMIYEQNTQPLAKLSFIGPSAPVSTTTNDGENYVYSLDSLTNLARGAKNMLQTFDYIQNS